MARILITDVNQKTRAPFLRGILTRSLEHAGLSFEEAYALASSIREDLADTQEITTDDLRARVADALRKQHGDLPARRYLTPVLAEESIMVASRNGQSAPFSRARHQRFLQACGLSADEARPITVKIYERLVARQTNRVTSNRLGLLTYRQLKREIGRKVAGRYLLWTQFIRSGRPLILLVGGTVGCGKSTIATEVAHHLEIVRIQSTDMLREVMRIMLPEKLLPVLHTSSFLAWRALANDNAAAPLAEDAAIQGYRNQASLLAVPCEAVVSRAIRERVSLILEGVHIEPGFGSRISHDGDAIVVSAMLSVLNPEKLRKRIQGRGRAEPQRRANRYLKNFEAIWQIQSHLLDEADRQRIAIIPNDDKGAAVGEVMIAIIDTLSREFSGTSEDVFHRDEDHSVSHR